MRKFAAGLCTASILLFGSSLASASVLYGVTGDGGSPSETLFTLNQSTAAETLVLGLGNGTDGETIGFNPVDGLVYHASGHTGSNVIFERINSTFTGTTNIAIGGALDDEEAQALTWDSSRGEFLWKQDHGTGPLFSVNATTGAETLIGGMDHQAKGLAFIGSTLYSADQGSNLLRTINSLTAATLGSVAITLPGFTVNGLNGLATRPEDDLLFAIARVSGGRRLITIDEMTGTATDIGALSTGYAGLAFTFTVDIPEPGTVGLLGLGLVGLGLARRKRAA